jgi:drug/metabolite transporter (DMT)-like permease
MLAAGVLLLRQRQPALQIVAAPLAVFGLTLIVGFDWSGLTANYRIGIVFGLLTAASYAGYLLCMRSARMGAERAVPLAEVAVVSWLVALLLGAAAIVEAQSLAIPTLADLGWLVAYGVLAHACGLILIASSLHAMSATETGVALLLQPALSLVWDVLFFGRVLDTVEFAGVLLTLGAIFLGSMANRAVGVAARSRSG